MSPPSAFTRGPSNRKTLEDQGVAPASQTPGHEASPSAAVSAASSQSRVPNAERLRAIAAYSDVPLSDDNRKALREAASHIELTNGAGICAYDRDECTVTLALDSEAKVEAFLAAFPSKRRVKVYDLGGVLAISSSACFFPEEDAPEQFDGQTFTWTFECLKSERPGAGLYRLEFVRTLSADERAKKSATLLAQAIEARRAATPKSGAVEDESAVRQDAPTPTPEKEQ